MLHQIRRITYAYCPQWLRQACACIETIAGGRWSLSINFYNTHKKLILKDSRVVYTIRTNYLASNSTANICVLSTVATTSMCVHRNDCWRSVELKYQLYNTHKKLILKDS